MGSDNLSDAATNQMHLREDLARKHRLEDAAEDLLGAAKLALYEIQRSERWHDQNGVTVSVYEVLRRAIHLAEEGDL